VKISGNKLLFVLASPLILLLGCAPETENAYGTTTTPSMTPAPNAQATKLLTVPPTLTDASLWTPLPTLSRSDADVLFRNWLTGTPTCFFPCWAGIVPGQMSWAEAIHILAPVFSLHISEDLAKCRFGPCRYLSWQYELEGNIYDGNLYSKGDVIYAVALHGDVPFEHTLREIFVKYGRPTKVFVHTNPYTFAGEPPQLDLVALYAHSNFVVRYTWQAEVKDENMTACGTASGYMLGIVAIDRNQWTSLEIAQTGMQLDNGATGDGGLQPIENVLDMNIDVFYQKVLDEGSSFCIETPLRYWQ